jgi:hypothetical protein
MLTLDSSRWSQLEHAYGFATDTPGLLRKLDKFPSSHGTSEPWFSLWSSLAHQGDVYPASFAAVPHIVAWIAKAPKEVTPDFLHFPTWVEICHKRNKIVIPEDLHDAYEAAIRSLPFVVPAIFQRESDNDLLRCALSAIAAGKGNPELGAAILELDVDTLVDFNLWFESR